MTEDAARKVANVLLGAVAVAAAYCVLRTPTLRRAAWRLAVTSITGTIPVWFGNEVRRAWADSGRRAL
jgi:hypothetical protein